MSRLIPDFILEKYNAGVFSGSLNAAVAFVDISGFSGMTGELMKNGDEGAEVLSAAVSSIFEPAIKTVYDMGGFVATLVGDGFYAVFSGESCRNVFAASSEILKIFEQNCIAKTRFGDFEISARIGISAGDVGWRIINNERQKSYFFFGNTVDRATECQQQCSRGQALFGKEMLSRAGDCKYEEAGRDMYRLLSAAGKPMDNNVFEENLQDEDFVPCSISSLKKAGEFRNVVSCFISLKNDKSSDEIASGVSSVIDIVHEYGGYFNRVSFGDKGGFILVFFGAPVSKEKLIIRACDFALKASGNEDIIESIGMTYSKVFAGFTGSSLRGEYTCYGNKVNHAAGLMKLGRNGLILLGNKLRALVHDDYKTEFHKDMELKDKSGSIPVFLLTDKKAKHSKPFYSGDTVGRDSEVAKIKELFAPGLINAQPAIVNIYGDAGIGKSRLAYESAAQIDCGVCVLQGDNVYAKSFGPFISYLNGYFLQDSAQTGSEKRNLFDKGISSIIDSLHEAGGDKSEETAAELERTKSLLAALLGIYQKDSLYEKLDPKGRYRNTLIALGSFFKALCHLKPTILILEDLHNLDSDSKAFFVDFTRNIENLEAGIIITSRYGEDGSKPCLANDIDLPVHDIELSDLSRESTAGMIEGYLGGIGSDELLEFVWQKTEGNPFFIEQMCLYLKESGYLKSKENAFVLEQPDTNIPDKISDVIMARIDRLSSGLKDLVQVASVLGREFELRVLRALIKMINSFIEGQGMEKLVVQGENEHIWARFSELEYIFRHTLLQETAYQMQLMERLRKLHRNAAITLEHLYQHDESHLPDIALHYERAEDSTKAKEYLGKAAIYAENNYKNEQAIKLYKKLLEYQTDPIEIIKTKRSLGSICDIIWLWDESEKYFRENVEAARNLDNPAILAKNLELLAGLLIKKDKPEAGIKYCEEAESYYKKLGNRNGIARSLGLRININFYRGNMDKAKFYAEKMLKMAEEIEDDVLIRKGTGNLGAINMQLGDYDTAMEYYIKTIKLHRDGGHKTGLSVNLGNLGILYYNMDNQKKAMECFMEKLRVSKELGNKEDMAMSMSNIGHVYRRAGNYQKAMDWYKKNLEMVKQVGDKKNTAYALSAIGLLYANMGEYDKTLEYYKKSLELQEKIDDIYGQGNTIGNIGDAYSNMNKLDKALEYFDKAIEIHTKLKRAHDLTHWYLGRGDVYWQQGKYEIAKKDLNESIKCSDMLSNSYTRFLGNIIIVKCERDAGNQDAALDILKELEKIANEPYLQAEVDYMYWTITGGQDRRQNSLNIYKKLYAKTPDTGYKKRIDALEKGVWKK